jgi:hypothetical protein
MILPAIKCPPEAFVFITKPQEINTQTSDRSLLLYLLNNKLFHSRDHVHGTKQTCQLIIHHVIL